jgi:hypothetical protein
MIATIKFVYPFISNIAKILIFKRDILPVVLYGYETLSLLLIKVRIHPTD